MPAPLRRSRTVRHIVGAGGEINKTGKSPRRHIRIGKDTAEQVRERHQSSQLDSKRGAGLACHKLAEGPNHIDGRRIVDQFGRVVRLPSGVVLIW